MWASVSAWLGRNANAIAALQSLSNIAALLVAAIWVLFLFDPFSQLRPELALSQQTTATRLGEGIIQLKMDFILTDTSKASARLQCYTVQILRLLPFNEDNISLIKKKIWDANDPAIVTLPGIKNLRFDQTIIVPGGGSATFSSIVFVPEYVGPTTSETIKSLAIIVRFHPEANCQLDHGYWETKTVFDIPPDSLPQKSQRLSSGPSVDTPNSPAP
jgi:hypothetical protein